MLWADVSWSERIAGLGGFHKLLLVPLVREPNPGGIAARPRSNLGCHAWDRPPQRAAERGLATKGLIEITGYFGFVLPKRPPYRPLNRGRRGKPGPLRHGRVFRRVTEIEINPSTSTAPGVVSILILSCNLRHLCLRFLIAVSSHRRLFRIFSPSIVSHCGGRATDTNLLLG
jgi:hypothetical protein